MLDDATLIIKGQWMPNKDLQEPIFILDPDVPLKFVQLPNGQYALVAELEGTMAGVVQNMHDDCLERLLADLHGNYSDGDEYTGRFDE